MRPSAASLFEQASALRDRNRIDEAIAVFRKLQQLFPSTRESRISFAVAGRMLLDRGRPAQALAQFDQHLAHRGEAPEVALAGRATALGQMGRVSAERETWQKVLDSYPGTVYASQAKERLSQMQRPQEAAAGIEHSR
jgi:tetratricopeptide (TPR) repeat protein